MIHNRFLATLPIKNRETPILSQKGSYPFEPKENYKKLIIFCCPPSPASPILILSSFLLLHLQLCRRSAAPCRHSSDLYDSAMIPMLFFSWRLNPTSRHSEATLKSNTKSNWATRKKKTGESTNSGRISAAEGALLEPKWIWHTYI